MHFLFGKCLINSFGILKIRLFFMLSGMDYLYISSLSSVAQLCPTLCDPMNCSMPGLPVHHQFPEPTQTHVQAQGYAGTLKEMSP